MKTLVKKIKFTTTIKVVTGLHIGGNSENVEIGGIDKPVIKIATRNHEPYIPGSSLKGKIRCLLEQTKGVVTIGQDEEINNLFGFASSKKEEKTQPSKLIVRDAFLSSRSSMLLRENSNLDMPYSEIKFENTIDRTKGTATNPRQIERVPVGAEFEAEFILNVWDSDKEDQLEDLFRKGIKLLENDYLGGNGSRGYGQIQFGEWNRIELSEETGWK